MTDKPMIMYKPNQLREVWIGKTVLRYPEATWYIHPDVQYLHFIASAKAISIRPIHRVSIEFHAGTWWIYPNPHGHTVPVSGR